LVEVPVEEEPERAAFAFFAWRFSFSDLLASVFELFEPPLSLLAMVAPSRRRDPGAERITLELTVRPTVTSGPWKKSPDCSTDSLVLPEARRYRVPHLSRQPVNNVP
jgi:hypothetical protein